MLSTRNDSVVTISQDQVKVNVILQISAATSATAGVGAVLIFLIFLIFYNLS